MSPHLLWCLFVLLLSIAPRPLRAETPAWILLAAPEIRPALDELIAVRRAANHRVVVLNPALAGDPEGARVAIREAAGSGTEPVMVLLAGTADPKAPAGVKLPAFHGSQGRMKALYTDYPYGLSDGGALPRAAVGRLPARSAEEAGQMAAKILAFEKSAGGADWRSRITALVGHPGGNSALERSLGAGYINMAVGSRIRSLHPRWSARLTADVPGSPWELEKSKLESEYLRQLTEGTLFFLYMGHSGPDGLYSDGSFFLETKAWSQASFPHGGIFVSCGCHALAPQRSSREGHGFTAMRNPRGPAAVMGAVDISYSAAGQLAFDGLLTLLQKEDPPALLADYWRAVLSGIAQGRMDATSFAMLDMADGSGGQVPLEDQRKEHVEMWELLGDPGMRLPLVPSTLKLSGPETCAPGQAFKVSGILPADFKTGTLQLTLERPPGETPAGADHTKANDPILSRQTVPLKENGFSDVTVTVPAGYTGDSVIVRAAAEADGTVSGGTLRLKVARP